MKVLKSKRGEGYILPCVFILIFSMIFAIVFMYISAVSMVNIMKENTKVVLDSFITQNATEIYSSIKQGNDYIEDVDSEEFRTSLISFCTFEERNGKLYSIDENGTEKFHISEPVITFQQEHELELMVSYTMSIPIYFAGANVTTASIPMQISSILTEKF